MSIYLIQRCHHYEGWNGREYDETIDTDYGYFTTREACAEACEKLNEPLRADLEKWNARQQEEHDRQRADYAAAIAQNEVLLKAGLPLVTVPRVAASFYTKTWQGNHDDSIYYEPVEIEEAGS
jgi:hypothetical protein